MTTDLEESADWREHLRARVSTLEAASDQHAVKISDHGGLLMSMDEDISKIQVEFRAQRGMLQALHDTQSEHITELREHTALLKEHSTQLGSLNAKVDLVQAGIGLIHEKLDELIARS